MDMLLRHVSMSEMFEFSAGDGAQSNAKAMRNDQADK